MICGRRSDFLCERPLKEGEPEDSWRDNNTCSYCGSYDPSLLLKDIEEKGITLTPTDKNYKVYVEGLPRGFTKFYFQHFDGEQKQRFVDLLNQGKVKLGYPGYFYVRPYFIKYLKDGE